MRGARAAFNGWVEHAQEAALAKRRLAIAAGEFLGRGFRAAWLQWTDVAAGRQQARAAMMRFVMRSTHAAMQRWRIWSDSALKLIY